VRTYGIGWKGAIMVTSDGARIKTVCSAWQNNCSNICSFKRKIPLYIIGIDAARIMSGQLFVPSLPLTALSDSPNL
jgi:hypothetical protein